MITIDMVRKCVDELRFVLGEDCVLTRPGDLAGYGMRPAMIAERSLLSCCYEGAKPSTRQCQSAAPIRLR